MELHSTKRFSAHHWPTQQLPWLLKAFHHQRKECRVKVLGLEVLNYELAGESELFTKELARIWVIQPPR
jgi:hypothetical protein